MGAALTAHAGPDTADTKAFQSHPGGRNQLREGPGLCWWKENLFLVPPGNHCTLCAEIRHPLHPPVAAGKGISGGDTSGKVCPIRSVALVP